MTRKTKIHIPSDVEQAEQALLHAEAVQAELRVALQKASIAVSDRQDALFKAWTKADLAGPLATISSPRGDRYEGVRRVVVVRRTASTVLTRNIGTRPDTTCQQWRKSKGASVWTEYPAPYYGALTLTLDEEAPCTAT